MLHAQIVKKYKRKFNRVHNQEMFKWHAIKQFQENFNINLKDFFQILKSL